jgi:lipopolysaccharide/colanic/teichoic acid biosynthesis glycosyltransferase
VADRGLTIFFRIAFWTLALAAAFSCIVLGWQWLASPRETSIFPGLVFLAGLAFLHGLLAFLLRQCLSPTPVSCAWRYRLSILISFLPAVIVSLAVIAWNLLAGANRVVWTGAAGWIAASALGSFIGGLAATARDEGLWEDNSPPPAAVKEAVLRLHSGVPAPLPQIDFSLRMPLAKRLFDLATSITGLVLSFPVWLVASFLIWWEDPGALLFVKNSVGRGGVNFRQFKLRTMVRGAEEATGPVMTQDGDTRILWAGRFLRKSHLDELPQLINILKGEMSVVGPRPQRTVLVYGYLLEDPAYAERHRVLPGLAGLAQVTGGYFLTPRQKLRLDRLYIQRMSLCLDLRLLLAAFLIAFWYRWRKGWDGQLPRWLLHG